MESDQKKDSPKKIIPCEVFSRVVGYYRPVSQWNLGKKEEFYQRKPATVESIKREVNPHPEISAK